MIEKEIQEVLDELNTVRPEKLNESGKRLFEAIMKIADERDKANNIINELEKDIDNQIKFCTNEANGTTNDKYCRIAIQYLKHLKQILDKVDKE